MHHEGLLCILILNVPCEEVSQKSTNCLTDPAALFEEQLPLKPGHTDQALNPSAWPRSPSSQRGAARWRCCQSLSPSPLFFPPVDPFFCEMIWYQSVSLRQYLFRDSQRSLPVQWLHWKKLISNVCAALIIFEANFLFLFYLFAFVACWAQGNMF